MREWTLHVCRACGDYALGGWEEVVHAPNQQCPGRADPRLVEPIVVVPKRDPGPADRLLFVDVVE